MGKADCQQCSSLAGLQVILEGLPGGQTQGEFPGADARATNLTMREIVSASEFGECLGLLAGQTQGLACLATLCLQSCPLREEHIPQLVKVLQSCGGLQDVGIEAGAAGNAVEGEAKDGADEDDCFDLFGSAGEVDFGADSVEVEAPAQVSAALVPDPSSKREGRCEVDVAALSSFSILRSADVPTEAWPPLWSSLPRTLLELDLTGNGLSDHAVGALCGMLKRGHCPRRLVLRGNRCKDIERMLCIISTGKLYELDLSDNFLNDKSAVQLAEAFESPEVALAHLSLAGNPRLTSAGLAKLLTGGRLRRCPLRALDLAGTSLCDSGARDLAREVLAASGSAPSLDLQLQATRMSSVGARQMLEAAQRSTKVEGITVDEGGERVRWRRASGLRDLVDD